jgi:site-specific DNA recombinase
MKKTFAYIRVSTTKQGQDGASLPEQRDSIEKFCLRQNLHITRWFEEQESAAKKGRKIFKEMLRLAKRGQAEALVFHKIDRSTRNLFEWAEVSSLPEQGIEVHYSHEPVDLMTNHGRTAADVAAVFASAFIRNLREETKKGMVGRLKQGLYPFKAPLGYKDNGRAQHKTICEVVGPLIKQIFEAYATGEYSLLELRDLSESLGLGRLSKNCLSTFLQNPFYIGLIKMKSSGETYPGGHVPLITTSLFDAVQRVFAGRNSHRSAKSTKTYSRMIKCKKCNQCVVAEFQRGHLYYRCRCLGNCLREDAIETKLQAALGSIALSEKYTVALREDLSTLQSGERMESNKSVSVANMQISLVEGRREKLTTAYLDGDVPKEEYLRLKETLQLELLRQHSLKTSLSETRVRQRDTQRGQLEQLFSIQHKYFLGNREQKRSLLKITTSNISLWQKTVDVQWCEPFLTLQKHRAVLECYPDLTALRSRQDGSELAPNVTLEIEEATRKQIRALAEDLLQVMREMPAYQYERLMQVLDADYKTDTPS